MAKHRADEPISDDVVDVVASAEAPLDVEVVALGSTAVDADYTPDGVPTFESVREKIETRLGTSIGSAELAAQTPEGRSVEEQYDARQRAAGERLKQIRASMRDEQGRP